jgi:hypothetical protein
MRQNMFKYNFNKDGILAGLLFNRTGSPPFGGSQEEYELLLKCI